MEHTPINKRRDYNKVKNKTVVIKIHKEWSISFLRLYTLWHNIKITLFSITSDEQQDVTYYTQYIVSQLHKKPKWRNSGAKAKYTHLCGCKWKLLYINNGNIWIIPIMHIWTLCVLSFWSLSIKICFHFKLYTYIYISTQNYTHKVALRVWFCIPETKEGFPDWNIGEKTISM